MRGCCAMLLVAAGCSSILGVKDITLGDGGAGSGDAANVKCIPGTLFSPCFTTLPTKPVDVTGTIDTDTSNLCAVSTQLGGGPEVCVIAGSTLNVPTNIRAQGSRPLVLAAVTDLTVNAMIDVSGGFTPAPAGANTGMCLGPGAGGDSPNSPGGGGGGGFGLVGEKGGPGSMSVASPGLGGGIGSAPKPAFVRGGCNGAAGGNVTATGASAVGGAGGAAGGAVYLVAGNSIDVAASATITAAGGGGKGGANGGSGGGGGASGGLVGLDSPGVFVEGVIYATGGGGGAGGYTGGAGGDGQDGTLGNASGGAGINGGGAGGSGGVGATAAMTGGAAACNGGCGGGGGGGSVGVVWMSYTTAGISGTISPDPIGP